MIVFTDLIEEVAARSLVAAVPVLARRHEVVVAGVIDPDLDALLRARPASELDVYRAAAALDVLAARERAAARVRGAGAARARDRAGRAVAGLRRRLPQREGAGAAVGRPLERKRQVPPESTSRSAASSPSITRRLRVSATGSTGGVGSFGAVGPCRPASTPWAAS